MPFPAGLTLVTVHGRFDSLPSGGASGRIRFECAYALLGPTDNSIVAPFTLYANLDADGEFTISLPATSDPGWTPVDWAYAVRATIGGVTITGTLQLDYLTTSVQLADLLQVDGATTAGTTYATLAQLNAVEDDAADRILSNLTSASTARTNLGLGAAALLPVGASGAATLDSAALLSVDQQTAGWDASPLRMPTWVQPSTILSNFQASHGWTNNAGSTLTANDTSDFTIGTQCAKIVTGGTGAQANLSRTGMSSFDATSKAVRVRLKVTDVTHMAEIGVFLGSSSFANFYKWSVEVTGTSKFIQSGEWITLTLSFHDATSSGSPNRAALTDARLFIIDDAAAPVTVRWQSFELIPDGSSSFSTGVISLCFDDSYAAQWSLAKPGLDSRGWPATAFAITDYIDSATPPGRLTLAQLKAMQDASGWEIAAHAYTGTNHTTSYTGLTAAQLEADIRAQHAWLLARGFRGADGTAYPLGQYGLTSDGQSTRDIVRSHWGYARTTHGRTVETFPPADRYRLRAISGISTFSGGYSPTTLTTAVTGDIALCAAQKSWLILVFHNIVTTTPASTGECLQSDFDAILAAITTAGIPVRTIADVLRTAA